MELNLLICQLLNLSNLFKDFIKITLNSFIIAKKYIFGFYLKKFIINLYINMQNIEMVNPIIIRRYHKKRDMSFNKFIISLVTVLAIGTYFCIYATNLKQLKI